MSVSSRLSPRGWRPAALLAWSAIAAGTGFSAGCGQKGPLTLPGAAVTTPVTTPVTKPVTKPVTTPVTTSPAAAASAPATR